MTLTKRISIVRTLTIIQLVVSAVVVLAVIGLVLTLVISQTSGDFEMDSQFIVPVILGSIVLAALILVLTALLPAIVYISLKKRTESWATAAFVSLIIQLGIGGGIFSVIPLVSLILLLDKEASAYIGMK